MRKFENGFAGLKKVNAAALFTGKSLAF